MIPFLLLNSSSGDIDKPVILVAGEFDTRILIGNGTRKYRKISDVSDGKLSRKHKKALLGLHLLAITMFQAFFAEGSNFAGSTSKRIQQFLTYSLL